MAAKKTVVAFDSQAAFERARQAIHKIEGGPSNQRTYTRRQAVLDEGAGCSAQNTKHVMSMKGLPTGGTFTIKYTTSGGTNTTIGIARNASAATIQTALEGLACIGSGNVTVTGGPINTAIVYIEFIATYAQVAIDLPIVDWGSITGGSGVGIDVYWSQVGR